jgi:enoyl-CoA hydratase/carnithine racemase
LFWRRLELGYSVLQFRRKEAVAVISIDAPPANAFTNQLILELGSAFDEANGDDSFRCVLIRSSNERIFLSGGDIGLSEKALSGGDIEAQIEYVRAVQAIIAKLGGMGKPTVASINGHAVGGGFEMAMACDYRVAADDDAITLGMPEVDLGFIPAVGGLERVSRKFGQHLALKMGFGARFSPKDAFRLGLVDGLYRKADLSKESIAFADKLSGMPTKALGMVKRIILEGNGESLKEVNKLELRCLREVLGTEDAKEGIKAFMERRDPQFKGR